MNPTWMLTMLVALSAAFAWSANRRWQLLKVGRGDDRSDRLLERLMGTYEYAFEQKKMGYYPLAGIAHKLIFVGFLVLLLRALILWGRGFDPAFNLWFLGPKPSHCRSSATCPSAPSTSSSRTPSRSSSSSARWSSSTTASSTTEAR